MRAVITPGPISGAIAAPPSKSMAHRALICAALACGESRISNLSDSEDIAATRGALELLGAKITPEGENGARVFGTGGRVAAPDAPVDCCESGSTLRFLIPVFARCGRPVVFTGRGRLMERPQTVYAELFDACSIPFSHTEESLRVSGALPAGEYTVRGDVSSQFLSGLLFALPLARGDSVLHIIPPFESRSYVALTLRALADFGVRAEFTGEYTIRIPGGQKYAPCDYTVEGDYSQTAFLAALGALCGGVTIGGLRPDTGQGDAVILALLRRCGARVTWENGAVRVEKSALHGTEIDLSDCPDLGPVLMALGAFCAGETVLRSAGRLRLKESDRIDAMETELRKMGADISSTVDTVAVRGAPLHGACDLDGHNDHRVVMALTVAALGAGVPVTIHGAEAVRKSWPGFFTELRKMGADITEPDGSVQP